jgi:hypothetical protein
MKYILLLVVSLLITPLFGQDSDSTNSRNTHTEVDDSKLKEMSLYETLSLLLQLALGGALYFYYHQAKAATKQTEVLIEQQKNSAEQTKILTTQTEVLIEQQKNSVEQTKILTTQTKVLIEQQKNSTEQTKILIEQQKNSIEQTKISNTSLERSTYLDFEASVFELSKLLIQNPQVRPYLYDQKALPSKTHDDYSLVDCYLNY